MVSVKDLCFCYKNSRTGENEAPVLSGLSFDIPEGSAVAVMGASGSGKTTLTKLLLGLETPTAGRIEGLSGLRISVVFQEDRLLPWFSARRNIAAVLPADKKSAELTDELLRETELSEAADKPLSELSGGMKRRVSIARALAFGGDLLILDEPLKGLDEELKKRIVPRIRKRFRTILLITHDEAEAKLFGCGEIIRLDQAN